MPESEVIRIHQRGRPVQYTTMRGEPIGCQHDRVAPMAPDFTESICIDCGATTHGGDDTPIPGYPLAEKSDEE